MKALEKKKIQENPNLLIWGEYLDIKTKDRGIQPLVPSFSQKRLLEINESLYRDGKPRRFIASKSRQVYISTITEAVMFADTSQKEGRNTLIIADSEQGSDYLYQMSRLFYLQLKDKYPHLTPHLGKMNSDGLSFDEINSNIYISTARNLQAGRKMSLQNVHLSEFAFFEHPQELMKGLMQSVPYTRDSLVVVETTSNGKGGYYYNEVMKAKDHRTDWVLYFVAWFECPDYTLPITPKIREFIEKTLTEEEKSLIHIYTVTFEQLWWRRWCIINNCSGMNKCTESGLYLPNEEDKNAMNTLHQEYPAYVEQSFIASGACRFETSVLDEWQNAAPKLKGKDETFIPGINYITGYFTITKDGFIDFIEQTDGPWKLFEYPELGIDYCTGGDVSEGIEVEEGTGDFDYSTIVILRRDTLEQVAEYRAYIEPDLLAYEWFVSLHYFNTPMAGVEANKDGQTTLKFLREVYGYNNIYVRDVIEEERQHRKTKKLGWLTSGGRLKGTRYTMINDMAQFIRNKEGIFRSQDLIGECFTFVKKPDGKIEHNVGCHDDLVFAAGIAIQMHLLTPKTEAWTKRKRLKISYKKARNA